MKKLVTLIYLTFVFNCLGQTKTMKTSDDCKLLSKVIVDLFKKTKITNAFEELKVYWPLEGNELDAFETKSLKYSNILIDRFGEIQGYEKIKEEKISDFALQETYILKYNYSAIRLIFTYYKSKDGWVINAFKWDDSFTQEFK